MNKHCFLVIFCVIFSGVLSSNWHYGDESQWPETCKTGKYQSPINLNDKKTKTRDFEKFHFNNYDIKLPARIKNNGHSVQLNLDPTTSTPKLTGGGLEKEYTLDHLHFHWQSEHTINGHSEASLFDHLVKTAMVTVTVLFRDIENLTLKLKRLLKNCDFKYPLEVHLVHYASDYGNLNNALLHTDGVAVLGVLYDYSPDDDDEFQPIIEVMENVEKSLHTDKYINKTKINGFLPRDTAGFYRYNGSLTTPGCTESVIWTVFSNTIPISKNQIKHFESVHTEEGVLKANYRSLQDLNERPVYQKVSPIPHSGADEQLLFPVLLSIVTFIMPFLI